MNSNSTATLLASLLSLSIATALPAQTATRSSSSAFDLAKYDKNKNGMLDVDELAAKQADEAKSARSVTASASSPNGESVVTLSPFEVVGEKRGYYGSTSMSGTRLNSKLEDLASSITVVTKEQMADFAMLDINDIFNYESNTEGTGNYSDIVIITPTSAHIRDGVQDSPNTANRIRGIDAANIALGGFETSGRVPIDPIDVDAVEISRGPNANIFGVGTPSGTVNMQQSMAHLNRNSSQVSARTDSYGGYRGSLDVNRVLKPGVLAIRGSAVTQYDGFVRRPSGVNTNRLNGMVTFQPFTRTTLRASYSNFNQAGNRPNFAPPRDTVGYWRRNGSPTWDPVLQQLKIGGQVVTPSTSPSLVRFPVTTTNDIPSIFVDEGKVQLWTVNRRSNNADPFGTIPGAANAIQFMQTRGEPLSTNQPLFPGFPTISDKSLYDWSRINWQAPNSTDSRTETWNVRLEQVIVRTARQSLAAQLAWMREDSESDSRKLVGGANGGTTSGYLQVDVNEKLLDGRPNPFFLRPYIGQFYPPTLVQTPLVRDNYRGQLAYELDLRREKSRLRWLGMHRVVGYGEYKRSVQTSWGYLAGVFDEHSWLPFGTVQFVNRPISGGVQFRYYVGDNQGQNMDYSPTGHKNGTHTFNWYNAATGQWIQEPTVLGEVSDLNQAVSGSRSILKAQGATLQSFFLNDRIVTTVGWREDQTFQMNRTALASALMRDARHFNFDYMHYWPNPWLRNEGPTRTAGVVVKPVRGNWLILHANKSDNFVPAGFARDVNGKILGNPEGRGEDYGFTLKVFDGKLVVKVNEYTTKVLAKRTTVSTALFNTDVSNGLNAPGSPFALPLQAELWIKEAAAARGVTLTPAQLDAEIIKATGVTEEWYSIFKTIRTGGTGGANAFTVSDTTDLVAKGREIEVNYNPSSHLTLKLNVTEQQTINQGLSKVLYEYVAKRLPFWQSVIDPRTGQKWYTTPYSTNGGVTVVTAETMVNRVLSDLNLARALEGKPNSQVRRYRANLSANYRLAGMTNHHHLKRMNVGGSIRWEDKGSIGYYGLQQLPASITQYDPARPIWSKANTYVDLFVGYRTRLFKDKIGTTFQINGRNLQEGGRLQTISAYPDGSPNVSRIIDPRQFIFTATFDL